MEWQPIETAPKNGDADILLYGVGLGEPEMFVGGWWALEEDWANQSGQIIRFTPTHWMPLPPEPNR